MRPQFQFLGLVEQDGRFPVVLHPVDVVAVRKQAELTIAKEPDSIAREYGDVRFNGSHTEECMQDCWSTPCILKQVSAARQRVRKLAMLHLLGDCARDPSRANRLRTLEGMPQGTCV